MDAPRLEGAATTPIGSSASGAIASRATQALGSIPAITLLALTAGDLIASAVVVETVFNRTGLGYITQQAVRDQDTPVILAVVMIVSSAFVLLNLLTDLVYPLIDPRISLKSTTTTRKAVLV